MLLLWSVSLLLLTPGSSAQRPLYPISGSWFQDFSSRHDVETTLRNFTEIGGDTVFLRGVPFQNRTKDSIKKDPLYSDCTVDGVHCVDRAVSSLTKHGLVIKQWVTYNYEDDFSDVVLQCPGFDEKVKVGDKVYMILTVWTEQYKTSGDCSFTKGSQVAVVLTLYSGRGDPHITLLEVADQMKLDAVYLGLARTPYVDESQESADLMQAYFGFVYRVIQDHQSRFKNFATMKGYYSAEEVIPAEILKEPSSSYRPANTSLPARYMVLYLRELMFLTGTANYFVWASPMLDLTHASNTTIKNHTDGMKSMFFFSGNQLLLRDGRGEGRAAYYTKEEANHTIYKSDRSLWEILKQKNSSVTEKTTYNDIYYAPIQEFFKELDFTGLWLMIEAYDNFTNQMSCKPIDHRGSGMNREVQRVHKDRLDKAISSVSLYVNKITAFAWNPMFTCMELGGASLADEIREHGSQPIISECRFHSQANQSVVLIGFNFDALMLKFNVSYELYNGKSESALLSGYYFELDYGEDHHLVKGMEYTQLFDIPYLRNLKREGIITVSIPGTKQTCSFQYELNQHGENTSPSINPDDVVG